MSNTYSTQPGATFIAVLGGMPSETGQLRPDYPAADLAAALAPPAAPVLAAGVAGALGTGQYRYTITFTNVRGETQPSAEATVAVAAQKVTVTIPTGPTGTTGRKIYRTIVAGSTGAELLAATVADNSTVSVLDNTADGALGVPQPVGNSTGVLGVQIVPLAGGAAITPRTTYGVQQELPHSAIYACTLTAPNSTGSYTVLWDASNGTAPFFTQTLAVDTTIPVTAASGQSLTPVYVQQSDCLAYSPGLVIDDPSAGGLFDQLIVRCELEIDSILGFWIRNPATGRKVNMTNIIPVAPISPFPGELFAPYQRGITIYQKAALQDAVCAQVEYHIEMGEEFFRKPQQYLSVSGPQFSYTRSTDAEPIRISPRARQHLAQMGLVRRVGRMVV